MNVFQIILDLLLLVLLMPNEAEQRGKPRCTESVCLGDRTGSQDIPAMREEPSSARQLLMLRNFLMLKI